MKRYIRSSRATTVDLSEEYAIGLKCIDELRKAYPDIPAKLRFRRSHAWADRWYIEFDLGINVRAEAIQYKDSIDPDNWNLYWDYIHDFEATCKKICNKPEFYNEFVHCCPIYYGDRNFDNAALFVYAITKQV